MLFNTGSSAGCYRAGGGRPGTGRNLWVQDHPGGPAGDRTVGIHPVSRASETTEGRMPGGL